MNTPVLGESTELLLSADDAMSVIIGREEHSADDSAALRSTLESEGRRPSGLDRPSEMALVSDRFYCSRAGSSGEVTVLEDNPTS